MINSLNGEYHSIAAKYDDVLGIMAVHQLSGMEILKQSITAEYNLGQDELPRP